MNKILLKLCIPTLALGMLASCETATTPPSTPVTDTTIVSSHDRALFVVNEGDFANGSLDVVLFHHVVSIHDSASKSDTTTTIDTIFHQGVLKNLGLGNDVLVNGNRAYVLDNGLAQIDVVDADSLKSLTAIPFGASNQPNKMALIGPNLLLVTQRAATSAAIVDLSKDAIVDTIGIGEPSYAVAVLGGKAYVTSGDSSYAGPFQLNIIDLASRKVTAVLPLTGSPEQAIADSTTGQVIIGSAGDYAQQKPRLYYVRPSVDAIADSLVFGADGKTDGELIAGPQPMIIISGNSYDVFKLDETNHQLGADLIHNSPHFYKGFYDATGNELYFGVYDFSSGGGKVDVYDGTTGTYRWSFSDPAGIAPAHFAFYH